VNFLLLAVCRLIVWRVCLDVLTDVRICVDLVLIKSVIMVIWQLGMVNQRCNTLAAMRQGSWLVVTMMIF